jgi:nitronate monooxygenase
MENPLSDLALCRLLNIKYPIIMAPMFLVSNEKMLIAASEAGIAGAIPALNYRTVEELRTGIRTIKAAATGPIGINLIVNVFLISKISSLQICTNHISIIKTCRDRQHQRGRNLPLDA